MKRIKQGHPSGCGLACVAMLAERNYDEIRDLAKEILEDFDDDHDLYTDTAHIRKLLSSFSIRTSLKKIPFTSWEKLPNTAMLGIRHNPKTGSWHWVVFQKNHHGAFVLDPKVTVKSDKRTDFNRIKPKWYIAIYN